MNVMVFQKFFDECLSHFLCVNKLKLLNQEKTVQS
jgi:hypothetical protein